MKVWVVVVGTLLAACIMLQSQQNDPLEFEVASVKENRSGLRGDAFRLSFHSDRMSAWNVPLMLLIAKAYGLIDGRQITGATGPLYNRYDVEAKASRKVSHEEMMRMLQKLLAERFGMVVSRQTRQVPGYALTVARQGPKLQVHSQPSEDAPKVKKQPDGELIFENCSMADFASVLLPQMLAGSFVTDDTGLKDKYDFRLSADFNVANPTGAPSIFTALEKQLGLKLESRRIAVEFLHIEKISKQPSEN